MCAVNIYILNYVMYLHAYMCAYIFRLIYYHNYNNVIPDDYIYYNNLLYICIWDMLYNLYSYPNMVLLLFT